MATINISELFTQRVEPGLLQYKAARRLLGTMDMITPQGLSDKLVELVKIMVRALKQPYAFYI